MTLKLSHTVITLKKSFREKGFLMKISELKEKLGLDLVTKSGYEDRDIEGCFVGDLLSWVMSHAESGNVWITIMNNINVTAVASLCDVSCVILAEGVTLPEDITKKADSVGIVVFKSEKSAYELAGMIYSEENL